MDLEGDAVHHARVLRLSPGDRVVLFNGAGGEYEGRISSCERSSVSVEALKFRAIERESPLRIILAQAISSSEN
ncbi:MAG: RNA methyltransferase PUA domain-containing protein, partial [Burkholderiales bacterium]